ncbi:MAG: hypothetical protein GF388_05840, partial [Candidatus Aegiribacteria sp.]|nr:hypothetical protein [Candidatus Aegiribacteria sp.]MBD3294705.1 hypothetical protein [Candidatus Fermentibacteria bacterium]
MKYFAVGICIAVAMNAVAGELTVDITHDASIFDIEYSEEYSRVTGEGMALTTSVGEPCLPVYMERIALPPGCAATSVEVVESSYAPAAIDCVVRPAEQPVPISAEQWSVEPLRPDPAIYASSSYYPENPVQFQGSSVIAGFPVAYLRVFPVRWNPAGESLEILISLTLRVRYQQNPAASTVTRRSFESEARNREIVQNTVINPDHVVASGALLSEQRDLEYGEYVIIATEEYSNYAQELADWKTSKGIPASVYTAEWIDTEYSSYDLQQDIRAFLTDCRDQGVEYVLIYGDDDVIAGRDAEIDAGGSPEYPPVDLYWSDINDMIPGADQWDSDNDHVWGEFGADNVDYHPDLWTGRASVNTVDDCQVFNQKVFIYEGVSSTDYFEDSGFQERIGYTTEMLWPGCYGSAGAELISEYVPAEWEEEKCYDSDDNNSVAITDSMLNAGPHHVYHSSHGNATIFSLPGGYYTTSDFMNLTNISDGGLPAIWNSISCLIGHFDNYECMADAWNNSPEGGGFGAFNARFGWGNPGNPGYGTSEVLSRYFYDVMWNDDLYILGVAHAMGDDEMSPPGSAYEDWCVKEYN